MPNWRTFFSELALVFGRVKPHLTWSAVGRLGGPVLGEGPAVLELVRARLDRVALARLDGVGPRHRAAGSPGLCKKTIHESG